MSLPILQRLGLGLLAGLATVSVSTAALPLERVLEAADVQVIAVRAQVNVILDATAERFSVYAEDPRNAASSCQVIGAVVECAAPETGDSSLRIDLIVAPSSRLQVRGAALDLAVGERVLEESEIEAIEQQMQTEVESLQAGAEAEAEASFADDDEDEEEASLYEKQATMAEHRLQSLRANRTLAATFSPISVDASDSTFYMSGPLGGVLRLEGSSGLIEDTRGALDLDLDSSALRVQRHQGDIQARAVGGSFDIVDSAGSYRFEGNAVEVELLQSRGAIEATLDAGSLRAEEVTGNLTFRGTDSLLDVSRSNLGQWKAEGRQLQLRATDISGNATIVLDGGNASFEAIGAMELTATGADVTTSRVEGTLNAELRDSAELQATGVSGQATISVNDSVFGIDGAQLLALSAASSVVDLRSIARIGAWNVVDSELRADFAGLVGRAGVKLDGETSADIRLATPCFVRLEGRTTPLSSGLRISGCEVLTAQNRRRTSRGGLQRLDGGRGMIFSVDLDQRASARIVGTD